LKFKAQLRSAWDFHRIIYSKNFFQTSKQDTKITSQIPSLKMDGFRHGLCKTVRAQTGGCSPQPIVIAHVSGFLFLSFSRKTDKAKL
jgi:hypothetical protein